MISIWYCVAKENLDSYVASYSLWFVRGVMPLQSFLEGLCLFIPVARPNSASSLVNVLYLVYYRSHTRPHYDVLKCYVVMCLNLPTSVFSHFWNKWPFKRRPKAWNDCVLPDCVHQPLTARSPNTLLMRRLIWQLLSAGCQREQLKTKFSTEL